ncbi:uncharacterized protein UV8b_07603 [Ustilaginoidea virens]|uniref:Uncharacterized protein n=1 Tax=Ustilaginoidea virens TaxID=1159556 RepID=A0A8E5ML60_USTVR|nr:uncharacterized protein UV8b_07603 [Ustilaginoidea virens]QUC23362.1 hypothetical protein UV8b_07603 [Ustilaginoidea virens]
MHLLRIVIALATLLAPVAMAALRLRDTIHTENLRIYDSFMSQIHLPMVYHAYLKNNRVHIDVYDHEGGKIVNYATYKSSTRAAAFFQYVSEQPPWKAAHLASS